MLPALRNAGERSETDDGRWRLGGGRCLRVGVYSVRAPLCHLCCVTSHIAGVGRRATGALCGMLRDWRRGRAFCLPCGGGGARCAFARRWQPLWRVRLRPGRRRAWQTAAARASAQPWFPSDGLFRAASLYLFQHRWRVLSRASLKTRHTTATFQLSSVRTPLRTLLL